MEDNYYRKWNISVIQLEKSRLQMLQAKARRKSRGEKKVTAYIISHSGLSKQQIRLVALVQI